MDNDEYRHLLRTLKDLLRARKVTYAKLASQWVELAQTAARTIAVTHQPRDLLGESEPLKTHDPRMH